MSGISVLPDNPDRADHPGLWWVSAIHWEANRVRARCTSTIASTSLWQ
jgi:hypothetical protein